MFIMRHLSRREIPEDGDVEFIDAFNVMPAGSRVRVEWGIGDLKRHAKISIVPE